MAFTNQQESTGHGAVGGGTLTVNHDPQGSVNYCVVIVTGGEADFSATATWGGVTITQRASYRYGFFGNGDVRCIVFAYTNDDGAGLPSTAQDLDVVVTGTPASGVDATIITGKTAGNSTLNQPWTDGGLNQGASDVYANADGTYYRAFAAFGGSNNMSSLPNIPPQVQKYIFYGSNSHGAHAYDTSDRLAGATFGFTGVITAVMAAGLYINEEDVIISPDPEGLVLGHNAGTIQAVGDTMLPGTRSGLVIGHNPGALCNTTEMQVALRANNGLGSGVTTGGVTGEVLRRLQGGLPYWSASSDAAFDTAYDEPVRFDTDGDGVADEFLFTDEGDIVVMKRWA